MIDFAVPDMAIAGFAVAAALLYAAWHEYSARNRRDANLLAVAGFVGFASSTAAWYY